MTRAEFIEHLVASGWTRRGDMFMRDQNRLTLVTIGIPPRDYVRASTNKENLRQGGAFLDDMWIDDQNKLRGIRK